MSASMGRGVRAVGRAGAVAAPGPRRTAPPAEEGPAIGVAGPAIDGAGPPIEGAGPPIDVAGDRRGQGSRGLSPDLPATADYARAC